MPVTYRRIAENHTSYAIYPCWTNSFPFHIQYLKEGDTKNERETEKRIPSVHVSHRTLVMFHQQKNDRRREKASAVNGIICMLDIVNHRQESFRAIHYFLSNVIDSEHSILFNKFDWLGLWRMIGRKSFLRSLSRIVLRFVVCVCVPPSRTKD